MNSKLYSILAKHPKKLFLLDSFGALATILFLSGILIPLESWFGMPAHILFYLSILAVVYGMYSISCAYLIKQSWVPFIRVIITGNILYCLLTTALVFHFYPQLTILGIFYFVLEIAVIISLVIIEQKALQHMIHLQQRP